MNRYAALFLAGVLVASFGQVLLKRGAMEAARADRDGRGDLGARRRMISPWVVGGYALMLAAMATSSVAYRGVPLKTGPVLESAGFVFVPCLGRLFFGDKLGPRRIAGLLLVMAGIAVSTI